LVGEIYSLVRALPSSGVSCTRIAFRTTAYHPIKICRGNSLPTCGTSFLPAHRRARRNFVAAFAQPSFLLQLLPYIFSRAIKNVWHSNCTSHLVRGHVFPGGVMRKLVFPILLSLLAAGLAQADQITFSATCDPSSPTPCASPDNLIGGPVSLSVSLGANTLVFTSTAATQVIQGGITSYDSYFANGGGTVQFFNSSKQLLADGTFLPGATSTSDQGGVFATFDGDVNFSYLNAALLGFSPQDTIGTGHVSYSFDVTQGPLGDTNFYSLDITGTAQAQTPEPATLLLVLVGASLLLASRSLLQNR
jgi:hypothetical protein